MLQPLPWRERLVLVADRDSLAVEQRLRSCCDISISLSRSDSEYVALQCDFHEEYNELTGKFPPARWPRRGSAR